MRAPALAAALVFGAPALATAADGALEISQSCALVGCFAGDGAAFPVTITSPGSYRLTGNLQVAGAFTDAILVQAADVSIDLGGFEIRGTTVCTGIPPTCAPPGNGDGITVDNFGTRDGVAVRNGSVTGMAQAGVAVGENGIVENVRAIANGATGIFGELSSVLVHNTSSRNGGAGVSGGGGSTISENTARENRAYGIFCGPGAVATSNAVLQNGSDGFLATDGCVIVDNAVRLNGTIASDDGIECGTGCSVRGNALRQNRGFGLNLQAGSVYLQNVLTENVAGTVTGAGTNLGSNHCAGFGTVMPTCP